MYDLNIISAASRAGSYGAGRITRVLSNQCAGFHWVQHAAGHLAVDLLLRLPGVVQGRKCACLWLVTDAVYFVPFSCVCVCFILNLRDSRLSSRSSVVVGECWCTCTCVIDKNTDKQ